MAVYQVFSHAELKKYRASVCSKATFVQLICILLTWILAFIVAYSTGGFWHKVGTFDEQPNIHFKYQALVVITTRSGSYVTWSTYQNYNQLQMAVLRIPVVQTREVDFNGDGLYDQLNFNLSMPMLSTEQVIGVQLLLVFDYVLTRYSNFEMEGLAYISKFSMSEGGQLDVVGTLSLQQNQPIGNKGIDHRYNYPVINVTSIYAQTFDFYNIFLNYTSRNVTTELVDVYNVWMTGRGAGQPFVIRVAIKYPTQYSILYYPSFWNMIKWGWVQYVALLVLFWFVFKKIKIFIFQHHVVSVIAEPRCKQKAL